MAKNLRCYLSGTDLPVQDLPSLMDALDKGLLRHSKTLGGVGWNKDRAPAGTVWFDWQAKSSDVRKLSSDIRIENQRLLEDWHKGLAAMVKAALQPQLKRGSKAETSDEAALRQRRGMASIRGIAGGRAPAPRPAPMPTPQPVSTPQPKPAPVSTSNGWLSQVPDAQLKIMAETGIDGAEAEWLRRYPPVQVTTITLTQSDIARLLLGQTVEQGDTVKVCLG